MMQIVINIPEHYYENNIKKELPIFLTEEQVVAILSKGHGDLVDYEEMKNIAREYGAYTEAILSHIKPKTIIGADKAESEVEE